MGRTEISANKIKSLIEDVVYLQDEAEALKYVIDSVPYDQADPAGGPSVLEMLITIDASQHGFYRMMIEDAIKSNRPINYNAYPRVDEAEYMTGEEDKSIQMVLFKIAKHRAGLLNSISKISFNQWERSITKSGIDLTLFDLIQEMVNNERKILKKIADLIFTFQQGQTLSRELKKRKG